MVSIAFSHDSKYLLVQGGHPDYQLVYFFWEKGKVITSITRVVSQSSGGSVGSISFNPKVWCSINSIYKLSLTEFDKLIV